MAETKAAIDIFNQLIPTTEGHVDLITHSTWMDLTQSFVSIVFALIALMIIRKLVYLDYRPKCKFCKGDKEHKKSENKENKDWKELAKENGDFKSIAIYHSIVFAFTAILLVAILY